MEHNEKRNKAHKVYSEVPYMKKYLVTGCSGFIGSFVADLLLRQGHTVVGVDNMNDYYDVDLKKYRLARLKEREGFRLVRGDIEKRETVGDVFDCLGPFGAVVNLAARAGVLRACIILSAMWQPTFQGRSISSICAVISECGSLF